MRYWKNVVTRATYHGIVGNGRKRATSAWMNLRMAETAVIVGDVEKGATSRGIAGKWLNQFTWVLINGNLEMAVA